MNLRRATTVLVAVAVIGTVLVPAVAQAQSGTFFPIVPCGTQGTDPCTPCGLLKVIERIARFVTFGVTGPIAAVLFIYVGFLFLTAAGNVNRITTAKRVLTNTVWGVVIILMSWLIIVQLIKVIAPGSQADRWYEFNCPEFLQSALDIKKIEVNPVDGDGAMSRLAASLERGLDCNVNFPELAEQFGTNPEPRAESAALVELRSCLLEDPVIQALHDPEQLFTYERFPLYCNVTRGVPVPACVAGCRATPPEKCACEHALESCHYGGASGSEGSEAVDFNARAGVTVYYIQEEDGTRTLSDQNAYNNTKNAAKNGDANAAELLAKMRYVSGEAGLYREIKSQRERCPFKYIKKHSNHTHVSTTQCTSDGVTPQ